MLSSVFWCCWVTGRSIEHCLQILLVCRSRKIGPLNRNRILLFSSLMNWAGIRERAWVSWFLVSVYVNIVNSVHMYANTGRWSYKCSCLEWKVCSRIGTHYLYSVHFMLIVWALSRYLVSMCGHCVLGVHNCCIYWNSPGIELLLLENFS